MVKILKGVFLVLVFFSQLACSEEESEAAFTDARLTAFKMDFVIIHSPNDPEMELRPGGIADVPYNIATWLAKDAASGGLAQIVRDDSSQGDGFDDRVLESSAKIRTANYFNSGETVYVSSSGLTPTEDGFDVEFPQHELFELHATINLKDEKYPLISYSIRAKVDGYYSVGYVGAPALNGEELDEVWQPLIWQELRVPDKSYLTLAYRATLPAAMTRSGKRAFATLAHPKELPFQPLPLATNSRFGVALKSPNASMKPMIFAPVLGGQGSALSPGSSFSFSFYAIDIEVDELTQAYEQLSREIYGFRDYRSNSIASLNTSFDNIVEYSLSPFAHWIKELKGSSYSTDVPGAVKNVSSLSALSLALVTDNESMFEERAYPLLEYMVSREKFLFSLDPEEKIQHPSRLLTGPAAPVTELAALYSIFGQANDFLITLAGQEYNRSRVRNLDYSLPGNTWQNDMALYRATDNDDHLAKAVAGADRYLADRVATMQDEFERGSFFWPRFTPNFIDLYQLYEITDDQKYLDAAQLGARRYTMFTWMAPKIPNQDVLVNEGGKAPIYWYLQGKGHRQMLADEESVPAWRLSEIGLTPESSGTSSGHRAIMMSNYAAWMLRIGHHANDQYLQEVAKASIIGRYRNFPGYHINTARTTVYEKADYPLKKHKDLSVNSFHYNHILPMASLVLDYLVSDVYVRSNGKVDFPSEFIEGYAYLQSKLYGHAPGTFYGEDNVQLWMPNNLLDIESLELNYISGYRGNSLYIAFTNQADRDVTSNFSLNGEHVLLGDNVVVSVLSEAGEKSVAQVKEDQLQVTTPSGGLTVLRIDGVTPKVLFQQKMMSFNDVAEKDFADLSFGNAQAMMFNLGALGQRVYVYLRDDDSKFKSVTMTYVNSAGAEITEVDSQFPYEFTVDIGDKAYFEYQMSAVKSNNEKVKSGNLSLGDK